MRRALDGRDIGQPDDARLGHAVVGDVVVAVQATDRRRQHDPAVVGAAHVRKRLAHHVERARRCTSSTASKSVWDISARVPPDVAGVVHQDVQPAEVVQRGGDDRPATGDRGHGVGGHHRAPAGRLDLGDHLGRRTHVGAVPGE